MDDMCINEMIKRAKGRELHVARKNEKYDPDKLPCKSCLVQGMCYLGSVFEDHNTCIFTLHTCKAKLEFLGIEKHDGESL